MKADGGSRAPGIGSGTYGEKTDITITGSAVIQQANGGKYAAGIGTGVSGVEANIAISGNAKVTAKGYDYAAGIGTAWKGGTATITIGGDAANVTAIGGKYGAGIGTGQEAKNANITISESATVNATGGEYAAGIGTGRKGTQADITISGDALVKAFGNQHGAAIGSAWEGGTISVLLKDTAKVYAYGKGYANAIGKGNSAGDASLELDDTITLWAQSGDASSVLTDNITYNSEDTYLVRNTNEASKASGYLTLLGGDGAELSYTLSENKLTIDGTEITAAKPIGTVGNWATLKQVQKHRVAFDLNYAGATDAPDAQEIKNGEKATEPTDPTRTGYIFKGWFTTADGNDTYDFSSAVTSDIIIYAHWVKEHTVTISQNYDGAPADEVQTVENGLSITLPAAPTREGYIFKGWNTSNAGTGTPYEANTQFTPITDTTLYAHWVKEHTVTFDLNYTGATDAPDAQKVEDGQQATEPTSPTREGYKFDGWYTNPDTTGTEYKFSTPVTSDLTLTAQWSIDTTINYTVTFDMGTGNPADNQTLSVQGGNKVTEPAEPNIASMADHVFVGWYADEDKTDLYDFNTPITHDVTIYAGWKQLTYTLHYGDGREHDGEWGYNYAEGQNGYYVPANPEPLPSEVRHFSESDVNVNDPRYPGVTISGWYFLSWMRYAETAKDKIDTAKDVYIKNGDTFEKITDWKSSDQPLYQYISEGQTPSTDCGNIEYSAQWMLIQIEVDVDVNIDVNISISGIGDSGAPVVIDESQKDALAKNVDLDTDVHGSNTEINITAFVRNTDDEDEQEALTDYLKDKYYYGFNRLDYDIYVTKEIKSGNEKPITYNLETLAEPIEIVFAIPDQWQRGGKVYMFLAHKEGEEIKSSELLDLDSDAATYTIKSDKFSTYTMIYVPYPDDDDTIYYTLHYESNGGTQYKDERYAKNTVVQLDKVPVREGYQFTGWYADKDLTEQITNIKMTGNKTVYAGWRKSTVPGMLNGNDHFAYVIGYTDGTVRPSANIARSEVAAIFFRLLKPEIRDGNLTDINTFTDVNEGMWCNKSISTLAALNIFRGRSAEHFDPNAPITRAEFAAICARFDTGITDGDSNFTDISGHWAESEIERAASLGWILGYTDGTFRPDNYITRAEAMTMINRVLCRIPQDEDDLLPGMNVWPDNQPGDWHYLAVQEATNSHDFRQKGEIHEHWTKLNDDPDWTKYQD